MDKNVKLALSQYLFSSFAVDKGSALLIKTLINRLNLSAVSNTLDIGCGVGVLGIALKMFNRDMIVHAQDRDSVAVNFTRYNFSLNNLEGYTAEGALALENNPVFRYDLIVSNLPAKAGLPVLEYIIKNTPGLLNPNGMCAFVIVKTLKDFFKSILKKSNAEQIYTVHDSGHSVFLYRNTYNPKTSVRAFNFKPYFRNTVNLARANISFSLKTVYGLPNFDSIDFSTSLAMDILESIKTEPLFKNILIQNPGQGHIPLYVIKKYSPSSLVLSGRDLLSLKISLFNIISSTYPADNVTLNHSILPCIGQNNYSLIVILPFHNHSIIDKEIFSEAVNNIFSRENFILISGMSYLIGRFINNLKKLTAFTIIKNRKNRAHRAILIGTG